MQVKRKKMPGPSGKRVLVTGAKGFLGRYLVPMFKRDGATVIIYPGDVRAIDRFKERADIVCHLAGVTKAGSKREVKEMLDVNIGGTFAALRYSERSGARFVFASSAAVYRPEKKMSMLAESARLEPATAYGASKLAAERVMREFADKGGISCTALRIFNIYGASQEEPFLIPYLVRCIKSGDRMKVRTPNAVRDFIHVDDVAAAFRAACGSSLRCSVLNVGTGMGTRIADVIAIIEGLLRRRAKFAGGYECDMSRDYVIADCVASTASVGWKARVGLRHGLASIFGERKRGALR